jgi:hypothetical protein
MRRNSRITLLLDGSDENEIQEYKFNITHLKVQSSFLVSVFFQVCFVHYDNLTLSYWKLYINNKQLVNYP